MDAKEIVECPRCHARFEVKKDDVARYKLGCPYCFTMELVVVQLEKTDDDYTKQA